MFLSLWIGVEHSSFEFPQQLRQGFVHCLVFTTSSQPQRMLGDCRYLGSQCAPTVKQEDEMADVRWFHWQWVARALGCTQPPVVPETEFHIPGPSSLAHRMIKSIVLEQMTWDGAAVPECVIEEGRCAASMLRFIC